MGTDKRIVDKFLRNPESKTNYQDQYIELLKSANEKINKKTDSSPSSFNSGTSQNESSQRAAQPLDSKNEAPKEGNAASDREGKNKPSTLFFIALSIILVVAAICYYRYLKREKEKVNAAKADDKTFVKDDYIDKVLKSDYFIGGKNLLVLVLILFALGIAVYAFTFLIKQVRNMDAAVNGTS